MRLLDAVNAVLPHLGEHIITAIETTKHPTVDLIVAAIGRQTNALLSEGFWFNELELTIPVGTDGTIDTPVNTLSIYGLDCNVSAEGEKLFNLDTGSIYFTKPIRVRLIRDIPFEKLPMYAALTITYNAGAEVYVADFGVESAVGSMQQLAEWNRRKLEQEDIRNTKPNSQRNTMRRTRGWAVRWR